MKKLFEWQEKCLQLWIENNYKGIVNVVTGAGKTILALGAIAKLEENDEFLKSNKLKIKIIVPKTFLVSQWSKVLKRELNVPHEMIGCYYGGYKEKTSKKYMIYVINSARYTLSRHIISDLKKGFSVLLICDECHHYASEENFRIFDFIPVITEYKSNYFSLGLSATPKTSNYEKTLIPALGKEIYKYNFLNALQAKIICDCTIFNIKLQFEPDEKILYEEISDKLSATLPKLYQLCPYLKVLKGQSYFVALQNLGLSPDLKIANLARVTLYLYYKRKEIVYLASSRINCVCELISRLPKYSKIIIFGERIAAAEILYDNLNEIYKGQVGKYHSLMNDNAKKIALTKYENAEIRILVSCRALDEGLNVPETDVGIVVSSSASQRQRIQRLGRILRVKSMGSVASFYYLYIVDSSEEEVFMPAEESGEMNVRELEYDLDKNAFYAPLFEKIKQEAIKIASKNKNINPEMLIELEKNFEIGIVRNDWYITESQCLQNVDNAATKEEKNYWISMMYLIKAKLSLYSRTNESILI